MKAAPQNLQYQILFVQASICEFRATNGKLFHLYRNTRRKYLNPSGDVLCRIDHFLQMTHNKEYYIMTPFIILRNGLAEAGRRVMFVFW